MPDPLVKSEGNLRFAALAVTGYPLDPHALAAQVRNFLDEQDIDAYGPTTIWLATGPGDDAVEAWDCQVGLACTGMPRPGAGVMIEDYRQLVALSVPHQGSVLDLPRTWKRLQDHGRSLGHRLRPYWRVCLRRRRLADGNLLPVADVAVFLDR